MNHYFQDSLNNNSYHFKKNINLEKKLVKIKTKSIFNTNIFLSVSLSLQFSCNLISSYYFVPCEELYLMTLNNFLITRFWDDLTIEISINHARFHYFKVYSTLFNFTLISIIFPIDWKYCFVLENWIAIPRSFFLSKRKPREEVWVQASDSSSRIDSFEERKSICCPPLIIREVNWSRRCK